jgi:hypothetical protein
MKKTIAFSCLFLVLSYTTLDAQSYEEVSFTDITSTPSASRSANFVDVNGDGWDDIFFSNGPSSGQNNMLYLNNTDGSFTTIVADDIVSDNDRSDGASFADVDNDGDLDALVVTYGFGSNGKKNYFYRNNGDASFTYEPSNAIGIPLTYSEMGAWIDVNNDQFLDAFITNSNGNLENLYFENQGDGSFQPENSLSITNENLLSRSIDWIDYDGDGDSDLFITNEDNANNSLFRNDGPNNFTQITNLAITQNGRTSAGSSWADIDNDGDFDLFVANWDGQDNQLFLNNGGTFSEQVGSVIATGGGNSFGSSFADMDNDGDLDLLVCNAYFPGQTKNFIYLNDGAGNFTQDLSSTLALHTGYTFGCAFGDYDNDGWLDVILANTLNENETNSVFHNTGSGNNWIKIVCKGNPSNRSAVGAVLRVRATINGSDVWQTRHIAAASGYCSQNSFTSHFGLGTATVVDEVEVRWPSGAIETFNGLQTNGHYVIEEGIGISLGITSAILKKGFVIVPVPADDLLFIHFDEPFSEQIKIELFDAIQNMVLLKVLTPEKESSIDISGLSTGTYLMRISVSNKIYHEKIIIR